MTGRVEEGFSDAAYRRIRGDLILGRLAPGAKLGLEGLRPVYGAGVATLREALNRLASEGLVLAEGQRGFAVAPVSVEDFREVAALRLLLEGHAIQASFAAGDLDWEGEVVGAHHKLAMIERRLLAGQAADAALWKRYDRDFHHVLIAACGSATLLEAYAAAYDRYLRYQMVAVVFRGAVAADQHAALLDCALRRDPAAACAILAAHVDGCVAHVAATGALDGFTPSPRRHPAPASAESASERAYRLIRGDLLRGILAPGQKLRLEALRDRYGAGISTLREVLSRLTVEQFIVAEGQRGFEVAPLSAANLHEVASLRLLLETHALEQAFHAGDLEWEARVIAAHHRLAQMQDRLRAGDAAALDQWRRLDAQFHQALISACGSRTLMATHAATFDRYLRYQNIALGFRGDIAVREHQALLDAALRRDAAAARQVLAGHIGGGVDQALASAAIEGARPLGPRARRA
ncbi:GntR family transcriptional regulator [Falsiroseomonas sp. E2-1-a20]|uniref:GntR family transcriptional regulator n=1 Tax=Falsiroseomonas sp. E2-1-a20 TaxID=3239300 RepID=UPI003F35F790